MNKIIEAIIHTPLWVFPLLAYLIYIGLKATKPRVVSLYQIFVIPLIFTSLSIYTLLSTVTGFIDIGVWFAALLLGTCFGMWQISRLDIRVDKKRLLIQVPGSWSTMVIMLIIFSSKYYAGYSLAKNPALANEIFFTLSMLSISGLCTGTFLGKLFVYLRQFTLTKTSLL